MTVPRGIPPLRIAVLVPGYNAAATVGAVVRNFRTALPEARVHVFDNNSSGADTPVP